MEQENFYLLLELQIDPPEVDPKVIVKALREKQAQWSRYRNHPTKAIQAKRYIGLIPEIKKVMSDPKLRKQEALKAKKILLERDQEKFVQIDQYLKLLVTKNGVNKNALDKLISAKSLDEERTREWVAKREAFFLLQQDVQQLTEKEKADDKRIEALAKTHAVEVETVQQLIDTIHKENINEIDKYLALRVRRGFITEQMIIELAHLYQVAEDVINRRIKCPIRKKNEKKKEKPQPLDPSIENTINDNLKILDKTSLYDFLGVVPSTSLENLQKRAKEKEMELRNIGQKSAATTAGSILAGQCISVFKTEESRNAYEITLAYAKLFSLDEEIRIAALNDPVSAEAYSLLLKSAMQIGLDPEEARDYLQEFAKKENITMTAPSKKKRKGVSIPLPGKYVKLAAAIGGVIMIIAALLLFRGLFADNVEKKYQEATLKIQKTEKLDEKIKILEQFVKNNKPSQYTTQARKEMRKIQDLLDDRQFSQISQTVAAMVNENRLEEALNGYHEFLKTHKKNKYADEVRGKIREIEALIDERDYKSAADSGIRDYAELLDKLNYYRQMHPDGKYAEAVKALTEKTIAAHFAILQKELTKFENNREWETCARIVGFFIDKYQEDPHASELKRMRAGYENNQRADLEIHTLEKKSAELGEDFDAAKKVYLDYLKINPEISNIMRNVIQEKINEIERRQKLYLSQKKEWEDLNKFATQASNTVSARLSRVEQYIQRNPSIRYLADAQNLLQTLITEKDKQNLQFSAQKEESDWKKLIADAANQRFNLTQKIEKTTAFLALHGNGKYGQDGRALLQKLTAEKQEEDDRIRKAQEYKRLRDQEAARIRSLLAHTKGRFADNGDGTIKDKTTGLNWCVIDSSVDLGRCINYFTAVEYVKNLSTGGHRDWRLPTINELFGIYKTEPFFPQGSASWYWSVNVIVKGWNKMAYIVTTKPETDWTKNEADLDQCGAVRAVR